MRQTLVQPPALVERPQSRSYLQTPAPACLHAANFDMPTADHCRAAAFVQGMP